jgi:hypothetical protein
LEGTLSPPIAAARHAADHAVCIEAEGQEHGFLQPLVHNPFAIGALLGDASLALVDQVDGGIHDVTHFAFRFSRERVARLPGRIDYAGKGFGHGFSPSSGSYFSVSRAASRKAARSPVT